MLRWEHWLFAAATAVGTVVLCLFVTFVVPSLFGVHQWLPMGDMAWTVQSAQFVAWGGLGHIYSANPQFLPLPGFLFVLAPAVALGNHLGLVNSYPYQLAHPSMWLVVAPVSAVSGSTAILGADYLAETLGVTRSRRRVIAVAIGLFVVIPTCCWAGHPEDLLALSLSCFAIALLLRQHHLRAAFVLSLAILTQPWAILLVPVLVVSCPRARRLRASVYASALPGLTAAFLLVSDFHDTFRSLVIQPMQGHGQRLPWWALGHRMFVLQSGGYVPVRVGSVSRTLAVVAAVAVATAIRRNVNQRTIMFAASVALVARGVFETQVWCWYLAPGAVFLALSAAALTDQGQARWTLGALSAFEFYGVVALGYMSDSMPSFLGLAVLLATAGCALTAAYWHRDHSFVGYGIRRRTKMMLFAADSDVPVVAMSSAARLSELGSTR